VLYRFLGSRAPRDLAVILPPISVGTDRVLEVQCGTPLALDVLKGVSYLGVQGPDRRYW
jgi:hypothetical protein